ncbi:uncharacterized protein LOC133530410 [Cydia pomonella]|uniref:uncharacterized protein LOC133530410 n=1 Tax=Cydia pomonella TaxID=82600 RepID=UPI002ADDCD6B|nr:uncharacterized protein LOC133530410 [Cydia pomonella]
MFIGQTVGEKVRDRDDITRVVRQPVFGSQDSRRARSRRFSIGPEQERSLPEPRRRKAGFAVRSAVQHPLSCNSPSSASTTSLAQLREKLTVLPPLKFTKVTAKIATTPELPALEEEEYERLSNRAPKPICGVSHRKQYHSDSEAQNFIKNTTYLLPIVEENSHSLVVTAALDTTVSSDQSAIIKTFEQLHNKVPQADLVNLLVEEALNYGQDKDSGIISVKITQDSDIVENTPFSETVHRKKLGLKRKTKDIKEIRYTTDDSDVVDDTPCSDYDWRKKCRTKSDKTNKNNNDENETLNEEAVDAYFCQETNKNYVDLISSATIKKISESLSQDEDSEIFCEMMDGIEIVEEEENARNLAFEADIVDCVNNVLDKVCNDLDKCVDLLAEQQEQIDILRAVKNIDDKSNNTSKRLKMNKDILKSPKETNELDTNGVQKVTLKFKPKKQATKKNTSRQKKAKCVQPPNDIQEDGDSKQNTKSPTNAIEQSIRQKRKLYSPKDDDNEINEIHRYKKERRPSSSTQSPIAACYKELENARKSRIRLPRKKKSTQPVISPNTKKLNDIFDKIKDNVVNNEKITLVDKKSDKDLSLYNLSSESDDEVFKKKKIQVQKRICPSSLESVTKRRQSVKSVNYTSFYSSEDECQRVVKPKAVKQTKTRSRKVKRTQSTNLIDERMRTDQPEVLESSFVQDKGDMNVPDEPQPAVNVSVLETIPADDLHDEPVVSGSKHQTLNNQEIIKIKTEKSLKKKCERLTKPTITKRSKEIITNVPTERESTTVSPLPGLVVETEPSKDDLCSSLDANLLQKLQNIYTGAEDLSTTRDTQNLLLNDNNNDGIKVDLLSKTCYNKNLTINLDNSNDNAVAPDNLQAGDKSDVNSEKSIETGGRSPITAHNNLDESPPSLDALNESFQHRDVDVEGRSRSITEFLANMRNQITNSKSVKSTSPIIPITRMSTSSRSKLCAKKKSELNGKPKKSDKSNPRVMLKRMPSEDIESHVNPVTPKSKASNVVLTRMSSEKFVTPTRTKTSSSTVTPVVVLNRVSSDEINKWLPMPETKDVLEKEPEIIPIKTLTRRKSVSKPCISCENFKQKISPVKLNFDIVDLKNATRDIRTSRTLRSRSQSSVKTNESRSKLEKVRTEIFESSKEVNDQDTSREETVVKSAETKNICNKEKTVRSTVDPSEMSKSVATVQSWIRKNAEARSSKTDHMASNTEMLYQQMMETLNTRLIEINEATGEAIQAVFLEDQESLANMAGQVRHMEEALQKTVNSVKSLKMRIITHQKNNMERACDLIRADGEKKARMVQLLKEDIVRILRQ